MTRSTDRYAHPSMKKLTDRQLRYAPRDVRLRQIENAEHLLNELVSEEEYHYRDICERITSFRPEMESDLLISGEDIVHDLRCFVEDLSESADISIEAVEEPVYTVKELSERYNVSTKTVDRWRDRGLVSRLFKIGNRKRVGFLKSSVDRFVERHSEEIHRGSKFSQLTEDERETIIHWARIMARYGGCPAEISKRLARKLNRSVEAIRYTLKNYDQEHPESAVFPQASAPMTNELRNEIFRSFRRGVGADVLANRYCRTKSSVYRIISEVRAQRLVEQPIDYMDSEEFHQDNAQELILTDPPEGKPVSTTRVPPGLPPYLASLYSIPLLTKDEEVFYFRKMNYLKYLACELQKTIDPTRPKTRDMNLIEEHLDKAVEIKNFLIRCNLRLVVSIAKRHIKPTGNFFEMVSDGNMSLIRAIEKFDYSKGNKFSTYASWAIMKNFARSIPAEHTRLDRFRTGKDEIFMQSTDDRGNPFQEEMDNKKQHQALMGILDQLDDREKDIIICRYGLVKGTEPQTLEQVGTRFGVTKERIRQLEARALKKAHKIAQEAGLDIPGV